MRDINIFETDMFPYLEGEDLNGQTVIETPAGPRKIPHIRHGEIGLMQVEE